MKIVGYTDELSVHPGQDVQFHVSCDAASYRADLVRLVHGDTNPDGPGFKVVEVPGLDLERPGRLQTARSGSHVVVDDHEVLRCTAPLTVQVLIAPTTPGRGEQGLVSKWDAVAGTGWALVLNESSQVELWVGDVDSEVQRIASGKPVLAGTWYLAAAILNVDGTATVRQLPVVTRTNGRFAIATSLDSTTATVTESLRVRPAADNGAPVILAGWSAGTSPTGHGLVEGHYNGKLDRPRLHGTALAEDDVRQAVEQPGQGGDLLAAWDFQAEIGPLGVHPTRQVTDYSGNQLTGRTINTPTRAATGYNWTSKEQNFTHAPEQYGAIHFHDDDLDDARWDVDFTLTVPEDLPSGVYAARLCAEDDTDYVPFYVRGRRGAEKKICFLAPTASYMAYANDHVSVSTPLAQLLVANVPVMSEGALTLSAHRELGLSTYDTHTDGSGVAYSSRLRPILNMRPGFRHWLSPSLWQFNADLHLLDWLEEGGYEFDVVTDQDLHLEGADSLSPYRVVITGSHPEYYSEQMLDALHDYTDSGGRMMYMGGNGFYWVINFDPDDKNLIEVRKGHASNAWKCAPGEYHLSFTGEYGTIWKWRGRAPQRICGVGFDAEGFDESSYYRRTPDGRAGGAAAWMFDGIDEDIVGDFGLVGDGAAGLEIDLFDPLQGTPPEAVIGATSEGHTDIYVEVVEDLFFNVPGVSGSQSSRVRSDLVYFPTPRGGGVFSTGSIAYCGALSHNGYDNSISRLTHNVLDRFLQDTPAPLGAGAVVPPT